MLNRVDRYVIRHILYPLFATLGVAAMLLMLERMLRLFDFVINQGGPVSVVWEMLGNLFPHYLGLALPIGFFLGIQLAIRKQSLNSEFDAMLSCGYSLQNWLKPALLIAFILFIFSIVLTGFIQPYSRYAYSGLVFDVRSGALGASIKANEFTSFGDGVTLRIGESREDGTVLSHIFVQKQQKSGRIFAVTAREGSFFTTSDQQSLLLRLRDGVLLDLSSSQVQPRVLTFTVHDLKIDLPAIEAFRGRGGGTKEMTLPELWQAGITAEDPRKSAPFLAPLNSQLARALTLLVIPFLALPLGMVMKRSTSALGITAGLTLMIVLHKGLEFGENFAVTGEIGIFWAIWAPTIAFTALGMRLFYIAAYEVGGVPLGRLQSFWDAMRSAGRVLMRWARRTT